MNIALSFRNDVFTLRGLSGVLRAWVEETKTNPWT